MIFYDILTAAELSKEMTASSRVWPYYTPWTLSDVKTAAWLVENDHLTQLEKVMFSSDLESTSITSDMDSIRRVAFVTLSKTDEEILIKPIQGLDIFFLLLLFLLHTKLHSRSCDHLYKQLTFSSLN